MVKRLLYLIVLALTVKFSAAQCPQIYDYLGNLSSHPYFVSCTGAPSYTLNFASNSSWGPYTIVWGDGSPNTVGTSYTSPAIINHTYNSATPDTFGITLIIPSLSCTLTGVAVMEKPVNASIQIPVGGVTTACAPKILSFTNSSTDVSKTTTFVWDFGDGTPTQSYNYTNAGQTVTHQYNKGTVNCQTQVTLSAKNYCTPAPTVANFNPIQIYDIDNAAITPSAFVKCWPDNIFTFTNTTNRNCVPQGNTFQRQEKWNLGNYWGMGHDSILDWRPWPPTTPVTVAYPAVGSYSVMLLDSNLCGVDTVILSVSIVNPPTAGVVGPSGPICVGSSATFTNTSSTGYIYKWNFGDGGGFVTKPYGPQSHTYSTAGPYTVQVVASIAGAGASCTSTAQVVINVLPKPTASFSVSPNKGCNSITGVVFTDQSTSAATWSWNFGNGNTFVGQTPPPQNYTSVGNFVATLTVTALNTCSNTFTAPVTVYQKPVAAFSPSISTCVAAPTVFTDQSTHAAGDPITGWTWNFGDATPTSTVTSPTHSYSAQNTYTVKLVVATANCKDSVSHPVSVNVKPTASFTYAPINGCTPLAVSFTNTSVSATSYAWKFGNGSTSTNTNVTQTYTNSTASNKTYTATLVAMTGLGCSDSVKHTITVFPRPVSSFTANATVGCSPVPATFTNTSSGATSYNWNFGDLGVSTATTAIVTHTYVNTTLLLQTYTVQLVATSANGCKDTAYSTVSAYPHPIFNFTMVPNSGCSPLTVNFPPVLGAVSYTWNFGDGTPVVNGANPTHTFTNTTTSSETFTVQLIASNAFSCIDTTYGFPVVLPKPNAAFASAPASGCSPLLVTYTSTSTAATTYSWNYGDGSAISTATNAPHTFTNSSTASQTFTVAMVAGNSFSCYDTAYAYPVVLPKPFAGFTYTPTAGCSPLTVSYNNTSFAANTYTWNFGDGTPVNTTISPVHTFTNSGTTTQTYTTQLIVGNSSLCYDTAFASPVVYAKPQVSFTYTPAIGCSPLPVSYTNGSSLATSYAWHFGDGGVSTQTNTTHTYNNPSHTLNQTYSCTLVGSTVNGCKDSVTHPVTVFYKPKADFSVDTPSCSPKILNFTNTSLGANSNHWDFGNGNVSGALNVTQQYINTTLANQVFTVQLIVTSPDNCKDTLSVPVVVHPKPEFTIVALPDSGCSPLTVNFPVIPGATSYQWTFGDGNVGNTGPGSNVYYNNSQSNKTFTVTLIGKNAFGCADTSTKTILVYSKPIALFQANPNTVFVPAEPVNCTNLSSGAVSYYWNFGDGGTSTETSPSYLYKGPGEYQIYLVATNAHGCKDTFDLPSKIIAQLESSVSVPNAFTPNPNGGNGGAYNSTDLNNDVFHPVLSGIDKYELDIFSRWGELLFVSKDVNVGWDGYYKGRLCTQDVYIWKIIATTLDGKKVNKAGDVLLLR